MPHRPSYRLPFHTHPSHPPQALAGPGNQPGPDDWVLEEFWHNDEMYLLDRKTGKMFTVPGDNNFPRPLGEEGEEEDLEAPGAVHGVWHNLTSTAAEYGAAERALCTCALLLRSHRHPHQ